MTRILTTILVLTFWQTSFAQIISIDTLFIPVNVKFTNGQYEILRFPLIRTGNQQIDNSINTDIKNRFTNNDYPTLPTDSTIIKWSDGQLLYLNFEVTYIKNGLISLNISAEGCGAYCTGWTDYFTYNYSTGKYVTIGEIIDTTGDFKNLVITERTDQYTQQTAELKERLTEHENDKETYEIVLKYYSDCSESFYFKSFALHNDYIAIIDNCYLPNVIKSMAPIIELNYKYFDIKDYLNIKYLINR